MPGKYSDFDRAAALTALEVNGGNIQKTAEQQGLPMVTLWEWAKGRHHPDVMKLKEKLTVELADRMEKLAGSCLDLLPSKLETATAAQLATIAGIAVDKMQVLRGKPDTIAQTVSNMTAEQIGTRVQEILTEARKRRIEAEGHSADTEADEEPA